MSPSVFVCSQTQIERGCHTPDCTPLIKTPPLPQHAHISAHRSAHVDTSVFSSNSDSESGDVG